MREKADEELINLKECMQAAYELNKTYYKTKNLLERNGIDIVGLFLVDFDKIVDRINIRIGQNHHKTD